MENLELKLDANGKDIVIREGKAPDIVKPLDINHAGTIKAPADYYTSKVKAGHKYNLAHALLTIDRDGRKLVLSLNDETTEFSEIVAGKLKEYTDLSKFKINTGNRWSTKQLADFIKMNRVYFVDRDAHIALIKNLKHFKAKVDTNLEDSDDSRGNKVLHFAQKLHTEITLDFQLSIPVFKGFEKHTFKVEVNFDIRDRALELWLESVELKELQDSLIDDILIEEMKRLEEIPFIEV